MKKRNPNRPRTAKDPICEIDEYARSLRTLGDCRKAVRDPGFNGSLFRLGQNAYEAIKVALVDIKVLLLHARVDVPDSWWRTGDCGPREEMLCCIRLMEFAAYYNGKDFYEILPNWPRRANASARVFDTAGFSHLHAAFDWVCDTGRGIKHVLQQASKKLGKDKEPDDLQVSYPPDPVIQRWLHETIESLQLDAKKYDQSRMDVEAGFDEVYKELAVERKDWEEDADDSQEIHIYLNQWKKSKSRTLMQRLLEDKEREGVSVKPKWHGTVRELRRILKNKGLATVATAITPVRKKTGVYCLNIPDNEVTWEKK